MCYTASSQLKNKWRSLQTQNGGNKYELIYIKISKAQSNLPSSNINPLMFTEDIL